MRIIVFILGVLSFSLAFSQSVGISNSAFTPQSLLHLQDAAGGNMLQISSSTAANTGFQINLSGTDFSLINREVGYLSFHTSNTERMRILSGGNVGIGNTAPTERLVVGGNVYAIGGDFYTSAGNGVINCGGGIMNANVNVISDGTVNLDLADGDEDLYINDDLEVDDDVRIEGGIDDGAGYGTNNFVLVTDGVGDITWTDPRLIPGGNDDWNLLGNAGTNPTTNFLGTTDAQDLVFRTNNTEKVRVLSNGNVGIGTSSPTFKLDVDGLATTTAIRGYYDANRYAYIGNPTYGVYSYMNTDASTGYGGYFNHTTSGSSGYGIRANAYYTGSSNPGYTYGAYIYSNSTTQDQYGTYNYVVHSGTSGFAYGIRNYVNMASGNSSTAYGLYNYSYRGGDDATNYGIFSSAYNGTTTYGIYATAAGGATNWAGYFASGDVYVQNNIDFDGALMPAGNPGTAGQVLTSSGAGTPVWSTPSSLPMYGNHTDNVTLNSLVTHTNNGTWQDIPGMSVTFTPVHNVIFIFASMTTRLADNSSMAQLGQAICAARVLVGGTVVAKSATVITDYDESTWGGTAMVTSGSIAFSGVRVACTAGVPIVIKMQWRPTVVWADSPWRIEINPGLADDHCTLTVFD